MTIFKRTIVSLFASHGMLGPLIALMSIFTALSSYQNMTLNSRANDISSHAQESLAFADSEYLFSNQEILQDQNLYHTYVIAQMKDEKDVAAYYRCNFSDELVNSISRPNGPFDAVYYNAMVADAEAGTEEALQLFAQAKDVSNAADGYAQTMLIFSVGLTLTAWGSLFENNNTMRAIFAMIALISFIFGGVLYFRIPLSY